MENGLYQRLKNAFDEYLQLNSTVDNNTLLSEIESVVLQDQETVRMSVKDRRALILKLFYSYRGLDALQPLLEEPGITEIMINRHDEIFIEKEGEIIRTNASFESPEKLEDIIQTIVGRVNRIVNESSPIVDARLEDGSRVNVVLPPISLKGATMTIRKFPEQPMGMDELIQREAITEAAAHLLKQLVQAKYNIFISGGTGSGKTTFLNALARYIPADERIITIEDSAELQIDTIPNLVRLETRNANTEGKGQIDISMLIRAALRMRPNRIIVGEVRGAEAMDMLNAMNTGHEGSLSTGHANSSIDMLSRLETMILSGAKLPLEVIRKQLSSAIDIMVHLSRLRDRSRRVIEINELVGYEHGEYQINPLFVFQEAEADAVEAGHPSARSKRVHGKLVPTGQALVDRWKLEMSGFTLGERGEIKRDRLP